jgi:geranylgeranyl pyrophosphate synthase
MGHLLISTAFRLLASLQNDCSATTSYQLFSRMFFMAARGQLWDVACEGRDEIPDLDQVLEVEYEKTGTLFELSTELGARLACVEPPTIERMALFGRKIGTAFQLLNDTNNLNGFEESTGRIRNSDLVCQKRTLILSYALATLPADESCHLQALLAERLVTPDAIDQVAEILERSGAVDHAVRQARTWLREAQDCLSSLPDSLARYALSAIAREVIATATDWSELTASSPATREP